MNIIYNGEIYLKRGPEIINPQNSKAYQILEELISDIRFDSSKENPDLSKLKYLESLEEYKNNLDSQETRINYSGTNTFWQLYTPDSNRIFMISNELYPLIKDYKSVENMNKDFIKLSDFLDISVFVGKEFVRTAPRITSRGKIDKGFMKTTLTKEKCIVLYAMQDLFLIIVKDDPFIDDRYELVSSKYTLDNNYKFIGKEYREYKDKAKVYKEIFKQLVGSPKKRKRTK